MADDVFGYVDVPGEGLKQVLVQTDLSNIGDIGDLNDVYVTLTNGKRALAVLLFAESGGDIQSNTVFIRTEADFPPEAFNAIYGVTGHTLVDGISYVLDPIGLATKIPIAFPLLSPRPANIKFSSRLDWTIQLEYTGTGAMLRVIGLVGSENEIQLELFGFAWSAPEVGASVYDIDANGGTVRFHAQKIGHFSCNEVGTFRGCVVNMLYGVVIFSGKGFTFIDNPEILIFGMDFEAGLNTAEIKMSFAGTITTLQIITSIFELKPNEILFKLDSAIIIVNTASWANNSLTGNTSVGTIFDPSGLDQNDPQFEFKNNGIRIPNSVNIGEMGMAENTTDTTINAINVPEKIAGTMVPNTLKRFTYINNRLTYIGLIEVNFVINVAIAARLSTGSSATHKCNFYVAVGLSDDGITSFADAGGGQVTVTTNIKHKLANGDTIKAEDTANYDEKYLISNITATTFDITASFVITETGTWKHIINGGFEGTNDLKNDSLNSSAYTTGVLLKTFDYIEIYSENTDTIRDILTDKIGIIISQIQ